MMIHCFFQYARAQLIIISILLLKAKLPYIKLHALRHSRASLLYHQGCIAQIADRMGHKSENVTRIYVHVFEEDFSDITNKLDCLMRGGVS